ncbi:MAG: hypothetical protein LKF61_00255 [Eggerthellaceae bacterium]|jgi:predicted Fe-Mo cluster-binding NifX family protein|nr:hypothetical protein [Eggerthellaceae bacterium]MCH4220389.1 hypothetical protein [Eggerthellaceae bacterium]
MRIAVASEGLDVAPQFAQCANFNYFTTKSFEIVDSQNIPFRSCTIDDCVRLFKTIGTDAIICDSISTVSQRILTDQGFEVVQQAHGNALQAAQRYIDARARELDNEVYDRL